MNITVAKQADIRANMKKYFDLAYEGETIIVPRKENRNIVILSETEYKRMDKARRNAEYLTMLEESDQELKAGKVVIKTMAELEAMAESCAESRSQKGAFSNLLNGKIRTKGC